MRLRGDDEQVSTLAPVVESDEDAAIDIEVPPVVVDEAPTNGAGPSADGA
jgi:hypothetical protein